MQKANELVLKVEMFLSENPLFTMILYFIGFLTSGYVTYLALSATSISTSSKLVWASYTIVMECGKAICFLQWVKTNKKSFMNMWLILTFFSIAASMTFMIIESNITENRAKNSSLYMEQTKDKESRLKNDLETAKKDVISAQNEKENAISSLSQQKSDISKMINDYNKNIKANQAKLEAAQAQLKHDISKGFITQQEADNAKIEQLNRDIKNDTKARDNLKPNDNLQQYDDNIVKAKDKVKEIEDKLNGIDYSSIPQAKATAGFYALFQFFGVNDKVIFWLEFLFTLAVTTTFEILICMLYSLSKTGHFPNFFNPDDKPKVKKPNLEKEQPKQEQPKQEQPKLEKSNLQPSISSGPTGNKNKSEDSGPKDNIIQFNSVKANESDIQKYLKEAKAHLKPNGELPGRKDMSNFTGFGTEKCRTIHNILKDRGILETGNKRTRFREVV